MTLDNPNFDSARKVAFGGLMLEIIICVIR